MKPWLINGCLNGFLFLYLCNLSENERNYFLLVTGQLLWWPSGPAQSRRRVSCPALSSKAQHSCGIAAVESPILLLDEAQRMQLNFLSQVQQSMAVCCCVLIHKPNGSDIGMVPSESKHGPFHTLILALSSVLCHQCIKDKFSESSSVSYFFEIRKCFFCVCVKHKVLTPDFIIFHIFVISIKHCVFSFIIASIFRW